MHSSRFIPVRDAVALCLGARLRMSGPGSISGRGHHVVFLDKTLYSHSASHYPGIYMLRGGVNCCCTVFKPRNFLTPCSGRCIYNPCNNTQQPISLPLSHMQRELYYRWPLCAARHVNLISYFIFSSWYSVSMIPPDVHLAWNFLSLTVTNLDMTKQDDN